MDRRLRDDERGRSSPGDGRLPASDVEPVSPHLGFPRHRQVAEADVARRVGTTGADADVIEEHHDLPAPDEPGTGDVEPDSRRPAAPARRRPPVAPRPAGTGVARRARRARRACRGPRGYRESAGPPGATGAARAVGAPRPAGSGGHGLRDGQHRRRGARRHDGPCRWRGVAVGMRRDGGGGRRVHR